MSKKSEKMYCPTCFNDSLRMSQRGTVHVEINNKRMDSRKFIYNKEKETHQEILKTLESKIDDFCKWYSSFQNKEPIFEVNIYSFDFICENGCRINITNKTSVLDTLFTTEEVKKILLDMSRKYSLDIEWQSKAA